MIDCISCMAAWRGTMFIYFWIGSMTCHDPLFPEMVPIESPWRFWFRFWNSSNLASFKWKSAEEMITTSRCYWCSHPTLLKTISVHMTRNLWNQNAPTHQLGLPEVLLSIKLRKHPHWFPSQCGCMAFLVPICMQQSANFATVNELNRPTRFQFQSLFCYCFFYVYHIINIESAEK